MGNGEDYDEKARGFRTAELHDIAAKPSYKYVTPWWHAVRAELARRGETVPPESTACVLCGSDPEPPPPCYYYYPVSSQSVVDYGSVTHTKTKWRSEDVTEVPICDPCLDSYRSSSLVLGWIVSLLSVCLVPFLIGILGVALGGYVLWSCRGSNRDEMGDRLAGCWIYHDSKSVLNLFRAPDFLTRKRWVAKAREQTPVEPT